MSKKNIFSILFVILLGSLSLYLNRDWFASDAIQITHRSIRPNSPRNWFKRRPAVKSEVNPVVFLINKKVKLTAVKVVLSSDIQTNKYPHAIWELVSDSNSVPVRDFYYGAPIRGMRPAVKGIPPDPLQPGVSYRVLIEADSDKAEHDFMPVAVSAPRTR